MKTAIAAAVLAFTLAACARSENVDENVVEINTSFDEATGNDPATTDLMLNSDVNEAEQAINSTDQQSDLDNTVSNAANSVANTAENTVE